MINYISEINNKLNPGKTHNSLLFRSKWLKQNNAWTVRTQFNKLVQNFYWFNIKYFCNRMECLSRVKSHGIGVFS